MYSFVTSSVRVIRYKRQLGAGLQREKALEQMKVQVELEWQRRCEDMKAQHYLANEQLIQELTQARDQVSFLYKTQALHPFLCGCTGAYI